MTNNEMFVVIAALGILVNIMVLWCDVHSIRNRVLRLERPAPKLLTLVERCWRGEPCGGICPKCGEERIEWPAGVGFGECLSCKEIRLHPWRYSTHTATPSRLNDAFDGALHRIVHWNDGPVPETKKHWNRGA